MSEFFDYLLERLGDEDRLVQARSAQLLGELGDAAAVGPLIKYVTESRYHCKTAGFQALAELLDDDADEVETLCELVDAPNCEDDWYWIGCKSVKASASLALLSLGEAYGERYLGELAEKGDTVFYAWFAPAILSLESDLPAVARLQEMLTVESILRPNKANATRLSEPGSLAMAAEAVGLLGTDEALLALRNLLIFRSRYVRGAAVLALAKADPDAPSEAAIAQIAEQGATDFERVRAAEAMCIIGRDGYAARLVEMAGSLAMEIDRYAAVQSLLAVEAELGIGGEAAMKAFTQALSDPAACVRAAAVEALDNCGGDDLSAIRKLYGDDPSVYVRMQAAAMLALRNGDES